MVELNANWGTGTPVVKISGRECSEPYVVNPLCQAVLAIKPETMCSGCIAGGWTVAIPILSCQIQLPLSGAVVSSSVLQLPTCNEPLMKPTLKASWSRSWARQHVTLLVLIC
jgi:hypothetical protein